MRYCLVVGDFDVRPSPRFTLDFFSKKKHMAPGLSGLTIFWFVASAATVCIDLSFVLGRPWTLTAKGIPWEWWQLYATHDRRYGDLNDGWVVVQSYLNVVEVVMQLAAVVLSFAGVRTIANKVAVTVAVMTFYKTVIYFLIEVFEDYRFTKHNSPKDLWLMVIIPSGVWLLMSLVVFLQSWARLGASSAVASAARKRA